MKAVVMGTAKMAFAKEVDDAKPAEGHVLIRVKKAAICGSDKHTWTDGTADKAIIGHEYSGVVVDPGPRKDLKAGDHVTSVTMNPCMKCEYCKEGHTSLCEGNNNFPGGGKIPGAFAELFSARADLVYKLADDLPFEVGAVVEPMSVCYHALKKVGLKKGGKLLINGVGILSAFTAQLARHMGASVIVATGSSEKRAQKLIDNGDLTAFVNRNSAGFADKLLEVSGGGFDALIDMMGTAEGINQHLAGVKKGGTCVVVGIDMHDRTGRVNSFEIMMNEQKLIGSFSYDNDEFAECVRLVNEKEIDPSRYIGATFKFDDAQKAFECACSAGDLKTLLEP